jgi:hypothetical protein
MNDADEQESSDEEEEEEEVKVESGVKSPCNEKKLQGPRRSPSPGEMKIKDKKSKMDGKSSLSSL